jgi:hypothetical protein
MRAVSVCGRQAVGITLLGVTSGPYAEILGEQAQGSPAQPGIHLGSTGRDLGAGLLASVSAQLSIT